MREKEKGEAERLFQPCLTENLRTALHKLEFVHVFGSDSHVRSKDMKTFFHMVSYGSTDWANL
jgi:hypothetical protein